MTNPRSSRAPSGAGPDLFRTAIPTRAAAHSVMVEQTPKITGWFIKFILESSTIPCGQPKKLLIRFNLHHDACGSHFLSDSNYPNCPKRQKRESIDGRDSVRIKREPRQPGRLPGLPGARSTCRKADHPRAIPTGRPSRNVSAQAMYFATA